MAHGVEIEVKYLVRSLPRVADRLQALGARLVQPRTHERNLRFDLPNGSLRLDKKVLRLRQDNQARLTFKGPGHAHDGIYARQEIEFVVEDFNKARHFLEALGYQPVMFYEKYRTTYALQNALVMLDEMPYGNFVEIEGESAAAIHTLTDQLGLNRACNICLSYAALFDRARQALGLTFTDLSFDNFRGISVPPSALGQTYADAPAAPGEA